MFSVLYVDDERDLLEIGKLFLEQFAEFSVDIHTAAREALASPKFRSYDVIVSDYQMPGMDGIEFLRTVRTQFGDIPFILFTGRGREEVVIQAINNGADFYLQKGGDPEAQFAELAHKVRQAVARRRAELSLIESEKRLFDIINFLPDATFAIDRDGVVIAWNRAIVEMTGVPAADMLGKGDFEYALPFYDVRRPILIDLIFEPDEIIAKNYTHIIHEKGILIADTTLPRPKGRMVTLLGKASPLYNRQGEIVGAIESIRDITELKKAEEGRSRAKKDWETIFRAIGHPAIVLDADNRIIDANDATLMVTGRTMDELKGKRCYEAFHNPGTDSPPESCPFEQLKKTGTIGTAEIEIEALNGFYHVSCTPVFDDAGRMEKVIHIAMDVTERRRAQDELKAAYEQLSASEEALRRQLDEILKAQLERAKTEENLRESEEKYRTLVEVNQDIIFSLSIDGTILYISPQIIDQLGYRPDEMEGRNFMQFIHTDDIENLILHIQEHFDAGKPVVPDHFRVRRKDGTYRWYEDKTIYETDRRGRQIVIGTIRDITEEKSAQDALRDSEEKYRTLIETTRTGFAVLDERGRVLNANPEYVHLTCHKSLDEIRGRNVIEWTADYEKEKNAEAVRQCIRDGFIRNLEIDYADDSGNIIPVEINATVLQSMGSVQILTLCRDITDRRRAQEKLQESEGKYRGIFENTTVAVFRTRLDGSIETANPAFAQLLGYETPEKSIRAIPDIRKIYVYPELRDTLFRTLADHGSVKDFELALWRPDGSFVWASVNVRATRDNDGKITGLEGLAIDITDRKRMEDELNLLKISVDHAYDEVFWLDFEGNILYVNDSACRITGYSREEFRTMKIFELDPDFPPEVWEWSVADLREKKTQFHTTRHRCKNSLVIDVEIVAVYVKKDDKEYSFAFVRDITERKQADEALRQANLVVENSPVVVFRWKAAEGWPVAYVSNNVTLFGYMPEELVSGTVPYSTLVHPDDLGRVSDEVQNYSREGIDQFRQEYRIVTRDGSIRWVDDRTVIERDVDGRITFYQGILIDMTERRLAEQNIQNTIAFLNALIEQNPNAIWISDEKGALIRMNAACCRLLHSTEEELVGKYNIFDDNIVKEQGYMPLVQSVFEECRVVSFLLTYDSSRLDAFTLKETVALVLEVTIFPVKDATGKLTNAVIIHNDITEQKRAEEALRESEERLKLAMDATSDGLFDWNIEKETVYFSPGYFMMLGYEPGALPASFETWNDLLHHDDRDRALAVIQEYREGLRDNHEMEFRLLAQDGSWKWILSRAKITGRTAAGMPVRMVGTHTDITDKKQAEEALRESEARLRSIMHGSPDLQFVIDRNHRVISWNKAIEEYSNIKAADIIGTDQQWRAFYKKKRPVLADLLVDGNSDSLVQLYAGKLRKSSYIEGAYEAIDFFPHMGTSGIWLSFTAAPVRDAQGKIIGAVETLEDVTERIHAEKLLRESEEKYRRILENMQDAYLRSDRNGNIVMVNPSAVRLYGYSSADEMIGIPAASLYRYPEKREEMIRKIKERGYLTDYEGEALRKDGSPVSVSMSVQFITDNRGTIQGTEAIVRDITKRKMMEHSVQEANRKLNLLNSITRHDVANQISILRGYTKIAQNKKPETVVMDLLGKIDTAASAISRQIEFTKMYQELGMHAPCWYRIDEIVAKLKPDGVSVTSTCKDIEIFADSMLEKVFFNLFDNAVRHGKRVTAITVRCWREPEDLVVIVEDNGIGIPAEDKEKIFERGYGKNTGLGLFLVQEILTITGITIKETGIPGQGARFEMLVPKNAFRFIA